MTIDTASVAAGVRDGIRSTDLRLSKYNPLPRILTFDDFNDGAHGWVELAYATTAYGAQGDTKTEGHLVMSVTTSAASAYVAMTRGRHHNTAHLVADSPEQARAIWEQALGRDRADLGVAHARLQALDAIDRYGPGGPATLRRMAAARQRAEQQRRAGNRREFEHWSDPAETTKTSRTGPGIGF